MFPGRLRLQELMFGLIDAWQSKQMSMADRTDSRCKRRRETVRSSPVRSLDESHVSESIPTRMIGPAESLTGLSEAYSDVTVGSPGHLRSTFAQAVAVTDRAMGYWLARNATPILADRSDHSEDGSGDIRALRALVRASATAYVRRLKETGVTPERMVVLVKEAAGHPGARGFAAQELTSDLVLWSIEAYFDD